MLNNLSGKKRRFITLSIAWIAFIAITVHRNSGYMHEFLYLGILPVATIWIYHWVKQGFKKDKGKKTLEDSDISKLG